MCDSPVNEKYEKWKEDIYHGDMLLEILVDYLDPDTIEECLAEYYDDHIKESGEKDVK